MSNGNIKKEHLVLVALQLLTFLGGGGGGGVGKMASL